MAKVIIIGAGLTGLSTAYHLEEKGFFDYKIFEKEQEIGGLCRSVFQDGFTFDFTGHLLHCNDPYFLSFIKKIVGLETFSQVTRNSYIYSNKVYTNYPFQTNLYGLPENIITQCIEGFVTKPQSSKAAKTYHEWVLQNFGAGFGKYFFFPYQKKIFAYDTHKLTCSWTGRFVPNTTLKQIISGALTPKTKNIGYNATFLYPKKGGIVSWVQKLAAQLINPIETNTCVKTVDIKRKIVHFTNGNSEPFEHLISTIPLDTLLSIAKETSTTSLKKAKRNLLCNSILNFNLGINKKNISEKSWIYFAENQFPFYRIGFPHTFSKNMTPPDCSSIYGEISYLKKNKYEQQTLKKALLQTKKLFNLKNKDIITQKILSISHAYVIYDHWREKNIEKLHKTLNKHSINSIGRYGQWKYSSMQEAVLDGKEMATQILTTKEPSFFIQKSTSQHKIEKEKQA